MEAILPHSNAPLIDTLPATEAALLVDEFAQARAAGVEADTSLHPDKAAAKADAFRAVGNTAIDALNRDGMSEQTGAAVISELFGVSDRIDNTPEEKRVGSARDREYAVALSGLTYQVSHTPVTKLRGMIAAAKDNVSKPQEAEASASAMPRPAGPEARDDRAEKLISDIVEAAGNSIQIRSDSRTGLSLWGPAKHAETDEGKGKGGLPATESMPTKACDTPWNSISNASIVKHTAHTADPRDVLVEAVAFTPARAYVPGVVEEKKGMFGRIKYEQKSVNHFEDATIETEHGTEPLVDVCYVFSPELTGNKNAYKSAEQNAAAGIPNEINVPAYRSYTASSGTAHRLGNHIYVRFALPKTMADTLQRVLSPPEEADDQQLPFARDEAQPEAIRTIVDKLVLKHGGSDVSKDDWYGTDAHPYPIRPPYNGLPKGWKLNIFDGVNYQKPYLDFALSKFDQTYGHTAVAFR